MRIPKYWALENGSARDPDGKAYSLDTWSWSDLSLDDAHQAAQRRVQELIARVQTGQAMRRYEYGERPLREEIVQGINGDQGRETGVITRNGFGASVLNASRALFADIDFAETGDKPAPRRWFGSAANKPPSEETRFLAGLEKWAAQNPGLGLRVYRTYGGLRCLVTNELFDPAQESTIRLLNELSNDPLYIKLCREQECFRARLSPKPWRCGIPDPPARYPWQDVRAELEFRSWDEKYQAASARYSVCRLLRQFGSQEVHPDIAPILDAHDQATSVDLSLPLA